MKKLIYTFLIVGTIIFYSCSHNSDKNNSFSKEEAILREQVKNDYQRPVYHASSPAYIMGDPNGLIQYKGVYHLFYQNSRPVNDSVSNTHWGHFTSTDLFHWKEQPVAISPEDSWKHCYSGSTVIYNDKPVAFFTGLSNKYPEVPCIAFSKDDNLNLWEQYENNPIIDKRPEGMPGGGFRDPYTWREGNTIYMALATSTDIGGAILLYSSEDLIKWVFHGPLYQGVIEEGWQSELFECPSFFPLDDSLYFLSYNKLFSSNGKLAPNRRPVYMIGKYKDYRFVPDNQYDLDLFNEMWAPQIFTDEDGRHLMFAVSFAERYEDFGWLGVQTMPRQILFDNNNKVKFLPVKEHEKLLSNHRSFHKLNISPQTHNALGNLKGDCLKLRVVFEPGYSATKFGVIVRKSIDYEEYTRILYDVDEKRILVDRKHSYPDGTLNEGFWNLNRKERGFIDLPKETPVVLEIFLDKSVIEVFVNEGLAAGITRVFPSKNSLGIDLFTEGGNAMVRSVDVWDIEL